MKRWIAFVLCCVFAFNLTACDTQTPAVQTTEVDQSDGQGTFTESTTAEPDEEATVESESAPVTGVTEVISAQYDEAWPFSEGFAVVGLNDGDGMKYNYIDTEGQLLLEEWVDVAQSFSEGLACVGYDANRSIGGKESITLFRYGYIDVTGELVIPAEILGTERDCPCAFYEGYAEINYYLEHSYYGFYTNVIDREGNRLFAFDVEQETSLVPSYRPSGYVQRKGRVVQLMAQGHEIGYYRYCTWMKAYVEGFDGNVILVESDSGTRSSHVADAEGNILRTMEGTVTALGDDYYVQSIVYNEPAKIYDSQWNLLDDQTYTGIKETEYGLYRATNMSGRYVLLNQYLTPLTDPYYGISIVPDGYLIDVGTTYRWKLRGPDGSETFVFSKVMYDCEYRSMDCYTVDGYREDVRGIYVGSDKDSRRLTHVFDENGQLLFSSQGIIEPEITLLREDGIWLVEGKEKDQVIDQNGNLIMELPYAGCMAYGAEGDRIYLCAGTDYSYGSSISSSYELMELINIDDRWELVDIGNFGIHEFDFRAPGYRIVLAENDESVIVSDGLNSGPVALELKDGTVLEENVKSVSLMEDGLYRVIGEAEGASLKYFGERVSETYDNLDVLSEDYIAFCEDGKWGYLKIERA